MIDTGNPSFVGFAPLELPARSIKALGAAPSEADRAAFELSFPAEGEEATTIGWPRSDLLLYPFDAAKPLGERILDSFARMKEALAPDAARPPVENGGEDEIEAVDSEAADSEAADSEANGLVTIETDGQGRTVIIDPDGTSTVIVKPQGELSLIVGDGDAILASIEQMRGEPEAAARIRDVMALLADLSRVALHQDDVW